MIMNDSRLQNEPCGLRLMRFMDTRLFDIIRREHGNDRSIHLYGTGAYWNAFEQSAYRLCRIFPESEITVVTHPAYPFPVVMASIPDGEMSAYARQHIFKHDDADYKELLADETGTQQYLVWHRQQVKEFF